ncbi:Glutamate/Leucine/Phenylalanine/Valine dehydrogenase-domain-containing protein [Cokeromyces recurvatus]|uniref:Glutamate/Leucine/Phenylalanine/Valine dehydrogenase-domain-containing protein n=1 Tax=Cokeromyces recurvatus TaxID=90255 RepID=UPI00221FCE73|nr:Glutamate/Leucine/Phenylalanine/Valine dehydrogenase-domain-containing protein [Cokeromyces recurvatus]KAI7900169.1 Glutamate/Leucine/Phenylalanine/Valine dehydrogenase-domain-containing protein [Cokeromyces recurvatus]
MKDTSYVLNNESGYATNVFAEKENWFLPKELVKNEVNWFYTNLNIDDYYFALESILAYTKNENVLDVNLEKESEDSAVYIHSSEPGVSQLNGPEIEKTIDEKFLDNSTSSQAYRLNLTNLQQKPRMNNLKQLTLDKSLIKTFLRKATDYTLNLYQDVMQTVLQRTGPVIEMYEGRYKGFFSAISDLYHYYDLYSTRKYVEQFSNGVTIIGLYLHPVPQSKAAPIEHTIYQVMKEASLLYCLPKTPLQHYFKTNKLSVQEMVYSYVGWIFAQHFLNRLGKEYLSLTSILNRSNPMHEEVLSKLKKRLRQDTFTRDYILDIIMSYPELLKILYANFATTHYVNQREASLQPTISYQRLTNMEVLSVDDISKRIKSVTSNAHEQLVFESFLTFNKHILKTNFYQTTKVALSFRLDPSFLPEIEYPLPPYGMFLIVGSEFRGFHIRFSDVARGGIRMIRSRNREAYSINLRTLFDENYNLANTQHRKNKDIPEGGSKGTILLDVDQQDKPLVAFEKYVDAVLDLLIDGETIGVKEKLVDLTEKPEILFLGPDEGTAEYMDWASQHARRRGASFWKAFTTGKSQSLGGIPHDVYGMTTRSVHQYVLGIYRTFGLQEEDCFKLQTGGPDGDLGSNEIKISNDKTIAVVDGSGVLYDSEGIHREELQRLANRRLMINNFDTSYLSSKGFRVLVDEDNVTLPDGTLVENGLQFRNTFHTNPLAQATLFVPCGGRPESVGLDNVHLLMGENHPSGAPLYKYIVEGANLFFTQEARLRLEKAGIVIFKDASANKGGVTSSSLEVLAALAFSDDEFEKHMCVKDGVVPEFYQSYVKEVQTFIEHNAALEFDALWREHQRTKQPISILSDELSTAIVQLQSQLQQSGLWDNSTLRTTLLLETVGLESLLQRVPESYVKAIFGAHLASQFVYKYGAHPDNFAFFEFMRENF